MRIIFVRHGHPNYATDSLTELGHKQAEAAALRLSSEQIDRVFSSSCGRAHQTAEYIAKARGMEVELLDFMREISWGSVDESELYNNGHPWRTVEKMVGEQQSLLSPDWREEEPFVRNKIVPLADRVGENLDAWLATLGYTREGDYYRVGKPQYDTIVLASHGGSSSAALAHLFCLPLPFLCYAICPAYTAITIVTLRGEEGSLISPRFELVNDARHIQGITVENVYGK